MWTDFSDGIFERKFTYNFMTRNLGIYPLSYCSVIVARKAQWIYIGGGGGVSNVCAGMFVAFCKIQSACPHSKYIYMEVLRTTKQEPP